ncbi:type II secretion system protein N [Rhodanobacter umsongensis]|uniref:Type II secretion system protein N n=1 Tax=Rhodanobacter umsongensis TaxID=633153 RepID=A0ABW0JPX0_9GAMM
MNYLRKSLLGLGVLLLTAAVLLWFLPARWALPWIEPQLHGLRLQQVQGSVWDGRAAEVTAPDGGVLGQLQWRLSRLALLGQLRLQLRFNGPQLHVSGTMARLPGDRIALDDANMRGDLSALHIDPGPPWGQPRGELQLSVDQAVLQGGWPLKLHGQAHWRHAVMHTSRGDVVLGELEMQAQAHGGVIEAQLRDDGNGPLHVDGQWQLSPLGWRLDATLRPRQTDPSLRHWLAGLGPASPDGSVPVHRSGGLAATSLAPPPK